MCKLRMSEDDLEKRLRIAGISRIEDVTSGTIEDNGELGYDLYPHAKPITREDLEHILKSYFPQVKVKSSLICLKVA
ncbi:YetF domain-containing protein [Paenibacillus chitinolyticus]|uniref:YetF domain-containing protein n=1 Tax=Paenibacillus chitinolyticus TaxID=79263 RepID=UPI003AF01E91